MFFCAGTEHLEAEPDFEDGDRSGPNRGKRGREKGTDLIYSKDGAKIDLSHFPYGYPTTVNDDWEVFPDDRVGLRKDKPEVLSLSAEMAPYYLSGSEFTTPTRAALRITFSF